MSIYAMTRNECETNSNTEYQDTNANKNVISDPVMQEQKQVQDGKSRVCKSESKEFTGYNRNKKVTVTLEFPTVSDPKAEVEFTSSLKSILLKRINLMAGQKSGSALELPSIKNKKESISNE